MTKLTQQELEMCYILSKIFDFGTDYKAMLQQQYEFVQESKKILQDTGYSNKFKKHYQKCLMRTEGREEESALERVRGKYLDIKDKILAINPRFDKKDLDKLFPLVAWICWSKPSPQAYWGVGDFDFWDKEEFFKEISNLKNPFSFCSYKLFRHIIMRIVKRHYVLICYAFDFINLTQIQQKAYLKKDFCIHYVWIYSCLIICIILGVAFAYFIFL